VVTRAPCALKRGYFEGVLKERCSSSLNDRSRRRTTSHWNIAPARGRCFLREEPPAGPQNVAQGATSGGSRATLGPRSHSMFSPGFLFQILDGALTFLLQHVFALGRRARLRGKAWLICENQACFARCSRGMDSGTALYRVSWCHQVFRFKEGGSLTFCVVQA
jgi:hypothetical protein